MKMKVEHYNMKNVNMKNVSISHGTLRTQDLLPSMLEACQEVAPAEYMQLMTLPFSFIPAYAEEDDDSEWWDSDDAAWKLEELFEVLDDAAPEGYYFGAREGDGSDFGFWAIDDEMMLG